MTLFKFIFAAYYLIKWFFRRFSKHYQASGVDLRHVFDRMRRDRDAAYSSDEDADMFQKNEDIVREFGDQSNEQTHETD